MKFGQLESFPKKDLRRGVSPATGANELTHTL